MNEYWLYVCAAVGSGFMALVGLKLKLQHEARLHRLDNAEALNLREMIIDHLSHKVHVERSFESVCKLLPGYSKDELHRKLVEAGAVCQERTDRKGVACEYWHLATRKKEWVNYRRTLSRTDPRGTA